MSNGKLDKNFIVVGMGVSSVDGVTPVPITIDPVNGRLRAQVNSLTNSNATPTRNIASMDKNGTPTILAETNDTSKTPTPVSVIAGAMMVQRN